MTKSLRKLTPVMIYVLLLVVTPIFCQASSGSSSGSESGSSASSASSATSSSGSGTSSGSSSGSGSGSSGANLKNHGKYIKMSDLLKAINSIRKTPEQWADKIDKEYIKNMDKDKVTHTVWKRAFKEGLPAMQEAVKYLKNAKPKEELKLSFGMCYAAFKHSEYLADKKSMTHTGKGGSSMSNRLEEFGDWQTTIGENIIKTTPNTRTAEHIVMELVIDDGVKNRGHRENIFKSSFKKLGVGIANEGNGEDIVTLVFSGGFRCKNCSKITKDNAAQMSWEGKIPEFKNFSLRFNIICLSVLALIQIAF